MESKFQKNIEQRAGTGVHGLDDILGGGLPRNHVYLIEGNPGSGKTTMALQFLLEGTRKGESGLYVTLSESKDELKQVANSHGWDLDKLTLHELATQEESLLPDGQYTFFHPSEVELGQATKSLIDEVERVKPLRVVFDSLSEMRLLARDPLRYRRQILGLKQFFVGRDCTVLLLDDLTSNDSDLQPQSLAHGVIRLEQLAPDFGADRRRLRVQKLRGARFRGGYHDFNIETGGLVVFPRLIASEHQSQFPLEAIPSGVPELDSLLGGGLDRGSSTLILGPAGAGKTSLATQFAWSAANRGENVAFFVFDEGVASLKARAKGLDMELDSHCESGRIQVQQIDPAELSPGEFIFKVRDAVVKNKAKVVVIDSLNGYMHAMPEERFLLVQLHELTSYLNQNGVMTILINAQHGLVTANGDTGESLNVSYLADSVVLLRYFEFSGQIRKAISVVKKRSGPHETSIRELQMDSKGLHVGSPLAGFTGILSGMPVYSGSSKQLMTGNNEEP